MDTALQTTDPRLGLPMAPGRWPLVGHMPLMFWNFQDGLRRAARETGPLCWFDMGMGNMVLFYTRSDAFELFKNKVTGSHHMAELADEIVGGSLLPTDGDPHRRMRGAMNKPFTPTGLSAAGVGQVIQSVIGTRVPTLVSRPSINVLQETQTLALDVIFRIIGITDADLEPWRYHYERLLVGGLGPRIDLPGTPLRRSRQSRVWLDEHFAEIIARARAGEPTQGLLSELVQGKDEEGRGLSEQELMGNLRLLALAGHETTASVMAWMLAYFATVPEYAQRALQEVRQHPTAPTNAKDLAAFPFIEAMFREILRMYPPATNLSRVVTGELVIDGTLIPPGVQLMIPIWLINHDPELYPDPDTFNPDRWIGRERKPTPIETAAFGGGPHFCLGYHMAWMEAVQFAVAFVGELDKQGKKLVMDGLPRVTAAPLMRPKKGDCGARVVAV